MVAAAAAAEAVAILDNEVAEPLILARILSRRIRIASFSASAEIAGFFVVSCVSSFVEEVSFELVAVLFKFAVSMIRSK